ncbi:N-acetyllactosaminide beta-1,3-N-acetylglucosaminyltransferase 3-like [Nematolebias whitei]|uniref:N-acetyllactosaminide beta-1,3-N-acetylglucosaminyltransferase 3-like n=1 Tax=Nematolebias whitei TaxID=451745 RepID=UPI00189B4D0E|nr:N-acetyllactosaminide beta-1,3-N-acetylglucosaminyltransferase 3-like [Nematolebias whitei]
MRISIRSFRGNFPRCSSQSTNMKRFLYMQYLLAPASFLLLLLMFFYFSGPKDHPDPETFNSSPQNDNLLTEKDIFSDEEPLPPKCDQNMMVAKIPGFAFLSSQIQMFLYYRHCHSFPIILDLPHKCGQAHKPEDILLLLVIKSPPQNYEHREVLRKTWAKERMHNGDWIRTIFITGTVGSGFEKERMNKLLALEHQRYNDILQWDFSESFFNLTLKQILFFEWMDKRCRHVRFLMNGDDDVFAHTENMVEYLQSLEDNDGSKHLFTGHVIKNAFPIRARWSKYYIPYQLHSKTAYPPYCGGGGYILSGYTALVIYNMSKSIPIYPIDDVYMGMCLAAAKIEPTTHMGVRTLGWYIPSKTLDKYDPCYMKELLLIHKFSPAEMFIMWHEVHNPKLRCGRQMLRW